MKKLLAFLVLAVMAVPAWSQEPPIAIVLGPRHAHGTPSSVGCAHLAGGNIIIAQPTPDVVVITMTGVTVATGHPFKDSMASLNFDLNQEFKLVFADAVKNKIAKLYMEARVIGLLRAESHCCGIGNAASCADGKCSGHGHKKACGTASHGTACAGISCAGKSLVSVCVQPHGVACGEYLSLNCQEGPLCTLIAPGCYTLHQTFQIMASHPHSILPCHAASAEFAPDALNPLWISYWEPFVGANKRDFGFQVLIRVVPEVIPEIPVDGFPAPVPVPAPSK
jgi:hypothetical protein